MDGLRRWSQRKMAARRAEPAANPQAETVPEAPMVGRGEAAGPGDALETSPETIDLASLPDPSSLEARDDVTVFLKKGVPADLRQAALRRAWTCDPAIADFRGFGEYDWDFNAPGYGGWIGTAEEALRMARDILGEEPEGPEAVADLDPDGDAAEREPPRPA